MSVREKVKAISDLPAQTTDFFEKFTDQCAPMIITHEGEPRAAVQDIESYKETKNREALLTMIAQSEKSICEGFGIDQEEVFSRLENDLFPGEDLS